MTGYQTIQRQIGEMDSLLDSIKEKQNSLSSEIDWLLADEMTKGIQVGSFLVPELLAIVQAAFNFHRDMQSGHEYLRDGKTARQQIEEAVDNFNDTRSDFETLMEDQQSKDLSKLILDIELEEMETVSGEFKKLAMEHNVFDLLADLWIQAKQKTLKEEVVVR